MSTFQNAAAYERYMSGWSCAAGEPFLDWLALPRGLRWLDVGCGSGAFTALLAERAAPAELHGIDRSAAMLAHARDRLRENVQLHEGDTTALPFAAARFDVAVMPLVIVFIDDPDRAVAEMRRVVRPGGTVATYIWDLPQGFPYYTAFAILRDLGVLPDRVAADESTALPQLQALWQRAGLQNVATAAFSVRQRYPDFAAYWQALQDSASIGERFAALSEATRQNVRDALRDRLPVAADGSITLAARAHAVRGRHAGLPLP